MTIFTWVDTSNVKLHVAICVKESSRVEVFKNLNEIALIFRHSSMPSTERNSQGSQGF